MKTISFETRDQWLLARQGKITGTRLKDIVVKRGTGKKLAFYELIAERLMVDDSTFDGYIPNETPMDRGTRLQKYAIDRFTKQTGKKVDESLVLWTREDNESIAISPDGKVIGEEAAVETKCLSSARHIEAFLTNAVPDEYEMQAIQYFIVNDKLETLYFCFYDPRIPCKDFFFLTLTRADMQAKADEYLTYQRKELAEVDEIVARLSNF
jgi:predicted phage-related endonuclease